MPFIWAIYRTSHFSIFFQTLEIMTCISVWLKRYTGMKRPRCTYNLKILVIKAIYGMNLEDKMDFIPFTVHYYYYVVKWVQERKKANCLLGDHLIWNEMVLCVSIEKHHKNWYFLSSTWIHEMQFYIRMCSVYTMHAIVIGDCHGKWCCSQL